MKRPTQNKAMAMKMMKKFVQQKMKTVQVHQVNLICLCCDSIVNLSKLGLDDEESTTAIPAEIDPNLVWPSMQDLNTRLRRVITSYQRNYKKEELKQQQKAKVRFVS